MINLSPNHREILELTHRLRFVDREILSALCARSPAPGAKQGFGHWAIMSAIRSMKRQQLLKTALFFPFDPMVRFGAGSSREILTLGPVGNALMNVSPFRRAKVQHKLQDYLMDVQVAPRRWDGHLGQRAEDQA
jgi:hypothetical protein